MIGVSITTAPYFNWDWRNIPIMPTASAQGPVATQSRVLLQDYLRRFSCLGGEVTDQSSLLGAHINHLAVARMRR